MGRLTQTLYRSWLAQNGAVDRSKHPTGGMGGMTPMKAHSGPSKPSSRGDCPTPAPVLAARPAQRSLNISE